MDTFISLFKNDRRLFDDVFANLSCIKSVKKDVESGRTVPPQWMNCYKLDGSEIKKLWKDHVEFGQDNVDFIRNQARDGRIEIQKKTEQLFWSCLLPSEQRLHLYMQKHTIVPLKKTITVNRIGIQMSDCIVRMVGACNALYYEMEQLGIDPQSEIETIRCFLRATITRLVNKETPADVREFKRQSIRFCKRVASRHLSDIPKMFGEINRIVTAGFGDGIDELMMRLLSNFRMGYCLYFPPFQTENDLYTAIADADNMDIGEFLCRIASIIFMYYSKKQECGSSNEELKELENAFAFHSRMVADLSVSSDASSPYLRCVDYCLQDVHQFALRVLSRLERLQDLVSIFPCTIILFYRSMVHMGWKSKQREVMEMYVQSSLRRLERTKDVRRFLPVFMRQVQWTFRNTPLMTIDEYMSFSFEELWKIKALLVKLRLDELEAEDDRALRSLVHSVFDRIVANSKSPQSTIPLPEGSSSALTTSARHQSKSQIKRANRQFKQQQQHQPTTTTTTSLPTAIEEIVVADTDIDDTDIDRLPNVDLKEIRRLRDLLSRLHDEHFEYVRQNGSHRILRNNETGQTIIVPHHSGSSEIPRGTLHNIVGRKTANR
jgi:predicted RNA binding protein YcfA (HicA-like mRNA interferase family)